MDLLQIWCIERSQWPDKQLRSQSAGRVVRRSGGQFLALIAKSGEQVGGGWVGELLWWCSCQFTRAGWSQPLVHCIRGQGPDTTLPMLLLLRYNLKAAEHGTTGQQWPRQAKECLPSCHQQLPKVVTKQLQSCHPAQKSPLHTSLVDHLSSSCQSQVLSAQSFPLKHLRRNNRFLTQCNDFVSEAMRPSKHKFVA